MSFSAGTMSARTIVRAVNLVVRLVGAGLGAVSLTQPYARIGGAAAARDVTLFEFRFVLGGLGHESVASAVLLCVLLIGFGSIVAIRGWRGGVGMGLGCLLFLVLTVGGTALGTDVTVSYRLGFYLAVAGTAVSLLEYGVPSGPPTEPRAPFG